MSKDNAATNCTNKQIYSNLEISRTVIPLLFAQYNQNHGSNVTFSYFYDLLFKLEELISHVSTVNHKVKNRETQIVKRTNWTVLAITMFSFVAAVGYFPACTKFS